jgi:hypothetical protein
MPEVQCKRRKSQKTCEKAPICKWSDDKCAFKVSPPKRVICSLRKEKSCKLVPEVCEWNGVKCLKLVAKAAPAQPKATSPPAQPKAASPPAQPKAPSPPAQPKAPSPQKAPSPPKAATPKMTNKHCTQISNNPSFTAIIDLKNDPKEKYDSSYRQTTNIHLGQRKLMLSEIQALNKFYQKYNTAPHILYIGAAPGIHLLTLSEMFPDVKFTLYDGAKFDRRLHNKPQFDLHEGEYFTDDVCNQLKDKYDNLLLISDIRLGDDDRNKFQQGVMRDMELQEQWTKILKPKMALLKFRLSYNMKHGDTLKYLKGDLLYGIWPKPLSGETRLLVTNCTKTQDYDFKSYEEALFYHNKNRRPTCTKTIPEAFAKYISNNDNIYCSCYDCIAELKILQEYAKQFNKDFDKVVINFGKSMNWQHKPAFQRAKPPFRK